MTDLRRSPLLVPALTMSVATVGATMFAISPLLPDIARAHEVTIARAGTMQAAFSVALAVAAPIVGLGAQRVPRVHLIVAALCVYALAWIGAGQSTRFEALLALSALAGAASGTALPAIYAYAADLADPANRAHLMGRVVSGWSVAVLLVVPLMSLAAHVIDWRWAFGGLSVSALLMAGLLVRAPRPAGPVQPESAAQAQSQAQEQSQSQSQSQAPGQGPVLNGPSAPAPAGGVLNSLVRVLGDGGMRRILAANLLDMGAFYAVYAYLGSELRRLNDWGPTPAGLTIAVYGAGLAVVTFNARLIDRLGMRRTAIGALLLLVVVLAILPWLASVPAAMAVGMFTWGCVQGAFFVSATALAADRIPALRGVATALLGSSTYVGVSLLTPVGTEVFERFGYGAVGVLSAASCLLAAGLLWGLEMPGPSSDPGTGRARDDGSAA